MMGEKELFCFLLQCGLSLIDRRSDSILRRIASFISSALVQSILTLTTTYLASALLGLYAAYEFYKGKVTKWLMITSAAATAIGLASTLILSLIGFGVRGVIGPAWIIFIINAMILWKERTRL